MSNPVIAKKSPNPGGVFIGVRLEGGGVGVVNLRIDADIPITAEQARELAWSLVELADDADAEVVAARARSEAERAEVERDACRRGTLTPVRSRRPWQR